MQNFKSLSIVMPFVIIHSRKQGAHASRPCVTSTALVRRFAPLNPAPAPSICRLRLTQKGEPPRAVLLPHSGGEENCAQSGSDCVVFLKLTALSYRSTRKKDFAERFFAKRSGERFKRGVRLRRTTRRVRSAATTTVRKEFRELIPDSGSARAPSRSRSSFRARGR